MADLIRLVSSSSAKNLMEGQEVDLLQIGRHQNAAQQVSGLLLYREGTLKQVLEGSEEAVQARYAQDRQK